MLLVGVVSGHSYLPGCSFGMARILYPCPIVPQSVLYLPCDRLMHGSLGENWQAGFSPITAVSQSLLGQNLCLPGGPDFCPFGNQNPIRDNA